jgi:hypothetical protein
MNTRSRKGAAMVEAAIIFPLVIAAVAAVIYIVTGLYESLSLQSSLHLALRKECGALSETVYRQETTENFQPERIRIGLRNAVRMEEEREYQINILFKDRITRKEQGRSYLINEPELIRILSFQEEKAK